MIMTLNMHTCSMLNHLLPALYFISIVQQWGCQVVGLGLNYSYRMHDQLHINFSLEYRIERLGSSSLARDETNNVIIIGYVSELVENACRNLFIQC